MCVCVGGGGGGDVLDLLLCEVEAQCGSLTHVPVQVQELQHVLSSSKTEQNTDKQ